MNRKVRNKELIERHSRLTTVPWLMVAVVIQVEIAVAEIWTCKTFGDTKTYYTNAPVNSTETQCKPNSRSEPSVNYVDTSAFESMILMEAEEIRKRTETHIREKVTVPIFAVTDSDVQFPSDEKREIPRGSYRSMDLRKRNTD